MYNHLLWYRSGKRTHQLTPPLPKVSNPSGVSDYRPMSLLQLPGKILEILLHTQLIDYLESNTLLNCKQNGFRKNHNTNDTVFKLTHNITRGMNSREYKNPFFRRFC